MVVADNSVVIASEDENPDMLFGIRGAGCNFRVDIRLAIRLYPQHRFVYAGPESEGRRDFKALLDLGSLLLVLNDYSFHDHFVLQDLDPKGS